ncbi:TetR/AcrR family transcriptional regulator [Enterococcus hulanensis]|uniref:TetR/AcrR family transcriptional regulator n=1 Tax=Enterococcus TaxID=1350 RepID=UPI000B5A91A2|nr:MULTISPECIES: TetR/AcrR family transcriptional regulator [Enterococcus]MBO0410834.1 TetR/AcrR family transcriptional regulator [Enterococcus hulanensis]OTO19515.1 hypothetical protein A5875_000848 [Enterococcus sp. 3H8_DIV0648]
MGENNQAQLSKKWIIAALLQLLEKKPYSEITITEITKKAGVARLTFYRNFDSKDQILLTRSEELFQEYLAEIKQSQETIDIRQALLHCFEYWQKDAKTMDLLIKNNLVYLIEQPFYTFLEEILAEIPDLKNLNDIQKTFILGGITRTMLHWISSGSTQSAVQVTEAILTLIDLDHLIKSEP